LNRFDANESVSHHDLQTHGLMLVRKEDPHFKASSGWAIRLIFFSFQSFKQLLLFQTQAAES
jgi:hypothetical protein